MFYQLIYVSSTTEPISPTEIAKILEISRQNNARDEVTGLLIYHNQLFFQVLEGPQPQVQMCFDRINKDRRHGNPAIVWEDQAVQRAFPEWSMGYAKPEDLGEDSGAATVSLAKLFERPAEEKDDAIIMSLVKTILSDFRDIE